MKGLLLKDLYMVKKFLWLYLLVIAMYIVATAFIDDYFFILMFPCILSGLLPVTLSGLDEQSGWVRYSGALPYTKAQIVSVKYIIGITFQFIIIFLISIIQAVKMGVAGSFNGREFFLLIAFMLAVTCFSFSVFPPFMYKFGVNKGAVIYGVGVGSAYLEGIIVSGIFRRSLNSDIRLFAVLPIILIAAAAVYGLSWYLSAVFYKKREI